MFDWKILASAVIALIIVSVILIGSFGGSGSLSDSIGSISDWFGSSPFGDFLSANRDNGKHVIVKLYPENLTIKPDEKVGVASPTTEFDGFSGSIQSNFNEGFIIFSEKNSGLQIKTKIDNVNITDLRLSKFNIERAKLDIDNEISTENGSIDMKGFSGNAFFSSNALILEGNVTKLSAQIGELSWELTP